MISDEERNIFLDEEMEKYISKGYSVSTHEIYEAVLVKRFVRSKLGCVLFILLIVVNCTLGIIGLELPPLLLFILCFAILSIIGLAQLKMQISLLVDGEGKIIKSQKLIFG
ncbi:MAG: hypothetical protein Q8L87_19095 [Anaerolineales bacterium]|nr:hypothetical protein [Anaerolineales bacterium]